MNSQPEHQATTGGDMGPHDMPSPPISQRQLDADMLRLQRAAAASHKQGQAVEAIRTTAALVMAVAGVIATLAGPGRQTLAIIGFGWFLVSAFLLRRVAIATALQGALLQEMFDTTLFHLPWRSTVAGDPIPDAEVRRLARKLELGSARDKRITEGWYDPTGKVHHPYDVLIAQEQNLTWDTRLRRRYAATIAAAALGWSLLGILAGVLAPTITLPDVLVTFYVPSLAAYQIASEIWIGQQRVATERDRLIRIVNTELRTAQPGRPTEAKWHQLRTMVRDVQDGILRTRLDATRVPEWFYRHHREGDKQDFAETTAEHRRRLERGGIAPGAAA